MNKSTRSNCTPLAISLLLAFVSVPTWSGSVPAGTGFTYQGHLYENGNPATGTYDFIFNLFDGPDPFDDNQIDSASVLATFVSSGLFQTEVDFGPGVFDGTAFWLQIEVRPAGSGGTVSLVPLQKITRTPYAIDSDTLDGIESDEFLTIEIDPTVNSLAQTDLACTDNDIARFAGGTWSCGVDNVGEIAAGVILMWAGSIASIPEGWAFCDGTNGTPDLRDRFIVGASEDDGGLPTSGIEGSLNQTGGSPILSGMTGSHSLTIAEMPSHSHSYTRSNQAHPRVADGVTTEPHRDSGNSTDATSAEGDGNPHAHTVETPPYFALAFIMKL